jgi:hypothetical protein
MFPFSYLYHNFQSDGDKSNEGPFLTELVYLPSHWVTDFSTKFSEMSQYGKLPRKSQSKVINNLPDKIILL